MGNAIVGVILLIIVIFAARSAIKKAKHGGGCCGEHEEAVKKVKVADKHKEHYPFSCVLAIDGMTCPNCVSRVENALNSLEGVWAEAELGERRAIVRMKSEIEDQTLRKTVSDAGYTVLEIMR